MHNRRRVAAFLGPAPADFALLSDPAFILHPDFDLLRLGMVALYLCQSLGELLLECRLSDRVCRNCSPPFQRDQAATGMMGLPARALVMACSAVRPCKRPVAITEAAAA